MECPFYKLGNKVRPEILFFAEQMELVMRNHDSEKGDSWKRMTDEFLLGKLREEYLEAISGTFSNEYIDVANVCMMLFWNACKRCNWNLPEATPNDKPDSKEI